MRVFLTGATGFIGARIVPELLAAGHQVLGMTRSDAGAAQLESAGAQAHRGTLEDLASIRAGAEQADAVLHTAFDHDFSNFVANCEKDARAIGALGEVLQGSDRPLVITSGVGLGGGVPGAPATEDRFDPHHQNPRMASELAGQEALEAGTHVIVMRLPQVHDTRKQGLITPYIELSRDKDLVAYLGEGTNRWSAAHVSDVARLYVLALGGEAGARYHAVGEEGVTMRAIAETIAAGTGLPLRSLSAEEAPAHFGWMAMFAGMDLPASSAITRAALGWEPTGPGLIEDLRNKDYAN